MTSISSFSPPLISSLRSRRLFAFFVTVPLSSSSSLSWSKNWKINGHHYSNTIKHPFTVTTTDIKMTVPSSLQISASSLDGDEMIRTNIKIDKEEKEGDHLMKQKQYCMKCNGMGKLPSKKRYRSKKKRLKQQQTQNKNNDNNSSPSFSRPMENCPTCHGSGLVLLASHKDGTNRNSGIPSDGTIDKSHMNTSNNDDGNDMSVSIVGGGIGGMALALALQHRNIQCTIYEKDTSFDERMQGYGLTIQQGNAALTSLLGSTEKTGSSKIPGGMQSRRHVVYNPEGTILGQWGHRVWTKPTDTTKKEKAPSKSNKTGSEKKKENKKAPRQNIHIARQSLRQVLYQQLLLHEDITDDRQQLPPSSVIQWGHQFLNYKETEEGVEMTFSVRNDNTELSSNEKQNNIAETKKIVKSTVLVGADGIFSKVRNQKFSTSKKDMNYLGCIVILGICSKPSSLDGETVFQTADGTTRLYVMPFGNNSIDSLLQKETQTNKNSILNSEDSKSSLETTTTTMWQLSFPYLEQDAIKLSQEGGPKALYEIALQRCGTWHDPIPEILKSTPTQLISGYPVYDRDIPTDNESFRNPTNKLNDIISTTPKNENDDNSLNDIHGSCKKISDTSTTSDISKVTFIGDAAHPMSPFKGQGANQALLDAVLLARTLHPLFQSASPAQESEVNFFQLLDQELTKYETEMINRSAVKVKASAEAAKILHSEVAIMEGNATRGHVQQHQQKLKCKGQK